MKTCLRGFANNTGADKPAHPRSLISALVIRFSESSYVNLLQVLFQFLASLCSRRDWFERLFAGNPKDGFSHDEAHIISRIFKGISLEKIIKHKLCLSYQIFSDLSCTDQTIISYQLFYKPKHAT